MAYAIVPSVITGQTYPASAYNSYVKGNFDAIWIYTNAGDILYAASASALARLGIGAAKTFLRSDGSAPTWASLLAGRQGGSSSDWSAQGSSNYSPAGVLLQSGVARVTLSGSPPSGTQAITFPVAFGQKPVVLLGLRGEGVVLGLMTIVYTDPTTTGCNILAGYSSTPGTYGTSVDISWLAIGAP